jgi:endo-1,4-beta-xylanase
VESYICWRVDALQASFRPVNLETSPRNPKMHFSNIIAGLALASSVVAMPPPPPGPAGPAGPAKPIGPPKDDHNDSLYKAMLKRGRSYIGTAVTLRNESREVDIIKKQFNSMTPENAMKWESTEPTQGNFTLADGDAHVAFAKQNNLKLRCHNLVWHSQLPPWVTGGNFTNATLIEVMESHIKKLVTHWKGDCYQWDVVNEGK